MNTINKITEGNAFALNIRQAVWRTLGGVIQPLLASELVDVHLYVGSGTSKSTATEYNVTTDGDTISAVMPATLKRGVYRTWMTAIYQGREVASACECAFEIVAFDEHGIYAPERIDGQPCVYLQGASMTDPEIEQYKARLLELQQQKEQEVQALEEQKQKLSDAIASIEGGFATDEQMQVAIAALKAILDSEAENAKKTDIDNLATHSDAEELKDSVRAIGNYPTTQEIVNSISDAIKLPVKYDGVETIGPKIGSVMSSIFERHTITHLTDDFYTEINPVISQNYYQLKEFISLKYLRFEKLLTINASEFIYGIPVLETIELPKVNFIDNYFFKRAPISVKRFYCPNLSDGFRDNQMNRMVNLIDVTVIPKSSTTLLSLWSPTNALLSDSTSLVNENESFSSNLEKFLYLLRTNIANNLEQTTEGYAISFSDAVKSAILADEETTNAFISKGWTIA